MSDAATRAYRVTFVHLHHGTKHEVIVQAPMDGIARKLAAQALAAHCAKTAGQPHDWAHYSTAEIGPS